MKKILTMAALACAVITASAAPVMNFSRSVRTSDGLPKANLPVKVKVAVHAGAPDGPVAFGEEHEVTTSPAGVAYVAVGSQNTNVTLDALDWGNTAYYMETAVDCGDGYGDAVCQQILEVPRAVHAATASSLTLASPSGKLFKVTISDDGTLSATPIE
ncbi:MAG: hypothetical protein NC210_02210 [[Clostridium] fimetarium]|nr:hypothetical protein [Alistipes timonensis]MCM1405214.1 hypothetical protein [[Clostridium] fimetarium]